MAYITLAGRLGKDATLTHTKDNTPMARFSIAWTESRRNGTQWEQTPTQWIDCTLFGTKAEKLSPHLTKGTHLTVAGDLSPYAYTNKDNQTHQGLNLNIKRLGFTYPEQTQPTDPWATSENPPF